MSMQRSMSRMTVMAPPVRVIINGSPESPRGRTISRATMIEFVVPGKPRVLGATTDSKARWTSQVQHEAPRLDNLLEGPLRLQIDFFFRGKTDLDTDNMIKPIQDALETILYEDDRTIEDVRARKINVDEHHLDLAGVPDVLRSALEDQQDDFVFIRVAPAHRRLVFA